MAVKDHSLDEKIIKAAWNEFMAYGFQKASLHKIANNAGITTGALYTRYKNKDALFCSLVEDAMASMTEKAKPMKEMYYAVEEKRKQGSKRIKALLAGLMLVLTSDLLFSGETKGFLNGVVSENICIVIIWIALGVQFVIIIESVLFFFGITDKFVQWQKHRSKNG